MMAAKAYGLKTVFTEHSLFGYNDLTGIHLNKVIKWSFRDLDAAICVSHACKDNFVLRAKVAPQKAFTIPNAVDSNRFTPDPSIRENELAQSGNPDQINIVFISRWQFSFDPASRCILTSSSRSDVHGLGSRNTEPIRESHQGHRPPQSLRVDGRQSGFTFSRWRSRCAEGDAASALPCSPTV